MTRDDIMHMAKEAGAGWTHNGTEPVLNGETQLETFAALVAAAEREACAKVCDDRASAVGTVSFSASARLDMARILAAAIRARGEGK